MNDHILKIMELQGEITDKNQQITELEARLAKAIELTKDEARCLGGWGCSDCKGAYNGDVYCDGIYNTLRAKLKARLGID